MFKLKTQNLKLEFSLSLRDLYPERWWAGPVLRAVQSFDKPVLRKPAASFDKLRTNGWFIEGLRTNGVEGERVGQSGVRVPQSETLWRYIMPRLSLKTENLQLKTLLAPCLLLLATLFLALPAWAAPGDLDTTFGTGGKVTTAIGSGGDSAHALGIQSDGKIVVAGESWNGSNTDFALVRYNTDGTLDSTFGAGGKITTDIGNSNDGAYALALQSDGKIVVTGTYTGANKDFALVRYNTDGTLDSTFGTGGKVTTDIGSDSDFAYAQALSIQSDGKIVAAGYSNIGGTNDFAVVRYIGGTALDTTPPPAQSPSTPAQPPQTPQAQP